jgi:Innexin
MQLRRESEGHLLFNGLSVVAFEIKLPTKKKLVRNNIMNIYHVRMRRYLWPSVLKDKKIHYQPTLSIKHLLSRTCFRMIGCRYANYLVGIYLFTKGFYIANAIGQLFALNAFLGTTFSSYGYDVIKAMIEGDDWAASKRFPRVTMCDLNVS